MNEEFSIMGIIVDEIEDIIQDYYPGKRFSILKVIRLQRSGIDTIKYHT